MKTTKIDLYLYELDVNYDMSHDPHKGNNKKTIEVDLENRCQLFNIIKKRKEYSSWQPDRKTRSMLVRALNKL